MPPDETFKSNNHDIDFDAQATSAAARQLTDVGADLLQARHTVGANLDAAGAARPWGRDELGEAFTRRYEEEAAQALDVWRTTADRLSELGVQVGQAADAVVETDRITSEVIDKAL